MKKVWAVARNTLAGALRMKIAVVVIVLLAALLPMMSLVMGGDGTLLGKLQTFSSYSLGLVGFMLCILTIAVSCFTLSDEIRCKQIFLTITKPIARWQILLGKFLGIIILDVVLLFVFAALVYGLTCMIPYVVEASPQERLAAQNEFFTAREGLKIQEDKDQLNKRVEERYLQLQKERRLPESMTQTEIMIQLVNEERTREQSINPGQSRQWDFHGVCPSTDPNTMIFVRFKYDATAAAPDGKVYGLWSVGDLPRYAQGALTTPIYNVSLSAPTRVAQEFEIPAAAVTQEGDLSVGFLNSPQLNFSTVVIQDMEVLYKVGTFTNNYCRALLLLLIRLVFLAALGITLTTWLSFPVAVLASIAVFMPSLFHVFIMGAIDSFGMAWIQTIYVLTIRPILILMPRFGGDFSPTEFLIAGRVINGWFLLKAIGEMVAIKSTLLLLLGMLVFRMREVAKAAV
jgi:hypothetical protein